MSQRPFQQVDVFTATPYRGNPLAVVLQADGLDDTTMQRFAHWTILSETSFLLDTPASVTGIQPDFGQLAAIGQKIGGAAKHAHAGVDGVRLEVRGFAPHLDVNEDPVTGSLNASLAQWLITDGHMPGHYQAAQGAALGRAGRAAPLAAGTIKENTP